MAFEVMPYYCPFLYSFSVLFTLTELSVSCHLPPNPDLGDQAELTKHHRFPRKGHSPPGKPRGPVGRKSWHSWPLLAEVVLGGQSTRRWPPPAAVSSLLQIAAGHSCASIHSRDRTIRSMRPPPPLMLALHRTKALSLHTLLPLTLI